MHGLAGNRRNLLGGRVGAGADPVVDALLHGVARAPRGVVAHLLLPMGHVARASDGQQGGGIRRGVRQGRLGIPRHHVVGSRQGNKLLY